MTPQRLHQIEEIFGRVLEIPSEQRSGILRASCGSDDSLRAELESLLRHADPPGEFLSDSALAVGIAIPALAASTDDLAGEMIGPYRLIRRLGSGGMGTVYLAARADGQFEQHVAIKLVKRGMDSHEILRRFEQERRTLASLNHPNIAHLLDGGAIPDGRPYLAMEFVDGAPVDKYCDANRLTTTQRLHLFCVVCDAVRFAHQKLVVHRDLKPSNILVDGQGIPKLLDFGISKVLADEGPDDVTISGMQRYTPAYASPEQVADQPLTTATDIYSLGVILYELLTGHHPYRLSTRSAAEFQRAVLNQQPLSPSAMIDSEKAHTTTDGVNSSLQSDIYPAREGTPERLFRRLKGDLDTIVLKSLQKDPARRYASVEQFVADIQRHLDGLPVMARPDTLRYRASKFVRRHALTVSLGVSAVIALTAGLGIAMWQGNVARHERDAAYLARDQSEATADFLQRMMAAADPANEGPDTKVRSVLDMAALHVDSDLKSQPLVQAAVRSTIGRTYLGLGLLEQAEKNINAAQATRKALLTPGHHDIAESEFDLAQLFFAQGKFAEAELLLIACLQTHRRLRGVENLDTARVLNDLGAVKRAAGKSSEAEAALQEALKIREKLTGRGSLEVAETLNNLSAVLQAKGDTRGAENLMSEVLKTRRRLLREDHPLVIQCMANLGLMASARGDLDGAEQLLRQAVVLDRKVYGDQHPSLAVDLDGLGRILVLQKRYADAEPLLREALDIRRRRLPPDDERLLMTQARLGECLVAQGRDAEAEPLLAGALKKAMEEARSKDSFWIEITDTLDKLRQRIGLPGKAQELGAPEVLQSNVL